MAYETLRAAVDNYIKQNGNKEITGVILNDILNSMITALGADVRFGGVATPSTNPGNPEGNIFYLASQAGTYVNFGGIVLPLGIHVLMWNGTAWSSQTFFSVDTIPTENSTNFATSGGIFAQIVEKVGIERVRAIGAEVTSCSFDSNTKKVSFFNSANTTLFQLDATAFVIDGMVSDVKIEDGNLVIQFNTDAGKQDIEIPLTDIFNPANYYTKSDVDGLLQTLNTNLSNTITELGTKLASGYLYKGIATPSTTPSTPVTKEFYIATEAGAYTNFGNIAVTAGINILKHDGTQWLKDTVILFDNEPTAGSDNLVKSGGVANEIIIKNNYEELKAGQIENYYINGSGNFVNQAPFAVNYYAVNAGDVIFGYAPYAFDNPSICTFALFSDVPAPSSTPILLSNINVSDFSFVIPSNGYIAIVSGTGAGLADSAKLWKSKKVKDLAEETAQKTIVFSLDEERSLGNIEGYLIRNNGSWQSGMPPYEVLYWSVTKGEIIKFSSLLRNQGYADCAFCNTLPVVNASFDYILRYNEVPQNNVIVSPINGYIVVNQYKASETTVLYREDTIENKFKKSISQYNGKTCLYIGDSISTANMYQWKGLIEDAYNMKYARDISGQLAPANGGIPLIPPVTESDDNTRKSIWYRCSQKRMGIYDFDVISLFGGTNDLDDNTPLGTIEDIPYVDNAASFEEGTTTDVRPESLTFCSALKGCIKMLQRDFPYNEIVIVTVTDCSISNYGQWQVPGWDDKTAFEVMARLQMQIAELYNLKCVPLHWVMNRDVCGLYQVDALHPNLQGALKIRAMFAKTLCL